MQDSAVFESPRMIVHLRFHFFAFGILELESPQGPPMGLPLPADTKVAHMSLLSLGILAPPLETHRPPPKDRPGDGPLGVRITILHGLPRFS